jgi:hypothetical protein
MSEVLESYKEVVIVIVHRDLLEACVSAVSTGIGKANDLNICDDLKGKGARSAEPRHRCDLFCQLENVH